MILGISMIVRYTNSVGYAAFPMPGSAPPPAHHDELEAVRALARLARLLEKASGNLGMAQYRVLSAIAAGDERASRVAERLGLGRPAISAAVDALCREGLLERSDAPGDQRAFDLSLTDAGRAQLAEVEARMVAVLSDLLARTGDPGVAGALAALGPALDAAHRERHARRTASA
jgi:DNA-binding MarR family transcriptional regulator